MEVYSKGEGLFAKMINFRWGLICGGGGAYSSMGAYSKIHGIHTTEPVLRFPYLVHFLNSFKGIFINTSLWIIFENQKQKKAETGRKKQI